MGSAETSTPAARRGSSGIPKTALIVWRILITVAVGWILARDARTPSPGDITFSLPGTDQPVVRLTGAMPDPQVSGQVFPRSSVVTGLQFLDDQGNEMGGFGTMPEDRRAMILCFDHRTAEAVCLTRIDEDITFAIMEPPAADARVGQTGPQRFGFGLLPGEGRSYLRLMDRDGRIRIRMEVDSTGTPVVETLDAGGNVTASLGGATR